MPILLALVGRFALVAVVSLLRSLAIVHRIFPNSVTEKPIILDDDHLDAEPAPRTLDSGQVNNNIFNMEVPSLLPHGTVNERDDGINDDKSTLVDK
jgi:hypothetical protein